MTRILITGVAGTGKSTICQELQSRGLEAHDADLVAGLAHWNTEANDESRQWIWDSQVLKDLLALSNNVILCGVSHNQDEFYELFDVVLLLRLPKDEELKRLLSRTGTSGVGHLKAQRDDIMKWKDDFEEATILRGAIVLDASHPTQSLANEVQQFQSS